MLYVWMLIRVAQIIAAATKN